MTIFFEETKARYRQKEYLNLLDSYRLALLETFSVYKENCGSRIDVTYVDGIWYAGEGLTALMDLAWAGNLEFVKVLVEAGADVNAVSKHGDFALGMAADEGWQGIFDYLFPLTREEYLRKAAARWLNKGIKHRRKENRRMTEVLVSASKSGDMEQFNIALRLGVDVNFVTSKNEAALHEACCRGRMGIVRALLDRGADVNLKVKGKTPAIQAASCGQIEILKFLVEAGADVNIHGRHSDPPLLAAKLNGHQEIFDYLLPLTNSEIRDAI